LRAVVGRQTPVPPVNLARDQPPIPDVGTPDDETKVRPESAT
jgi:hypothetical protein